MDEHSFRKLDRAQRLGAVRAHGVEVAQRHYRGFHVRLFAIDRFYVEAWSRLGLDMVEWLEVMPLSRVADVYGGDISLD